MDSLPGLWSILSGRPPWFSLSVVIDVGSILLGRSKFFHGKRGNLDPADLLLIWLNRPHLRLDRHLPGRDLPGGDLSVCLDLDS